jgi:hypothetical protein
VFFDDHRLVVSVVPDHRQHHIERYDHDQATVVSPLRDAAMFKELSHDSRSIAVHPIAIAPEAPQPIDQPGICAPGSVKPFPVPVEGVLADRESHAILASSRSCM